MFSYLKKKAHENSANDIFGKIIDDPVFGKIKYVSVWKTIEPIEIKFFGKTLSVNCYADTNERSEEPNEIQKTAFKRFMAEKETLMSETEKILSDFFKPDDSFNMSDVISILSIDINRDGKCGLFTVFNRQYLFDFDLDELGIEHG